MAERPYRFASAGTSSPIAVITLARRGAIKATKAALTAQRRKPTHIEHRAILSLANEYLAEQPELITEAKDRVGRWLVCAKLESDAQQRKGPRFNGSAVQMSGAKPVGMALLD
jgi:hypothetical protein